jgi:hypothetical protein
MKKISAVAVGVTMSLLFSIGPVYAASVSSGGGLLPASILDAANNVPLMTNVTGALAGAADQSGTSALPNSLPGSSDTLGSLPNLGDALNNLPGGGSALNNVPGVGDVLHNLPGNTSIPGVTQGKNSVSINTDRSLVLAGIPNFDQVKVKVSYSAAQASSLSVTVPAGATVTDNGGGTVSGSNLTWTIDPKTKGSGSATYTLTFDGKGSSADSISGMITHTVTLTSSDNKTLANASTQTQVINAGAGTEDRPQYVYGYPDKTFHPDGKLTRAEGIAVVVRVMFPDLDKSAPVQQSFKDVSASHWAAHEIAKGVQEGLVSGYGDGTFKPNQTMTRGEYITVLSRALMKDPVSNLHIPFPDVKSASLQSAVGILQQLNVLNGFPDGTLKPNLDLTRKEVVAMTNKVVLRLPLSDGKATFKDVSPSAWYFGDVEAAATSQKYLRNPFPGNPLKGVGTLLGQ